MAESRFVKAFRQTQAATKLDLPTGVGQQSGTFIFNLVNGVSGRLIKVLTPDMSQPPVLSFDTTRTIKRQLSNLNLGYADTAAVNPATDRLALFMRFGGIDYPLGRFIFTDFSNSIYSSGALSNGILMDEMFIVDQQIEQGVSAEFIPNAYMRNPTGVAPVTYVMDQIAKLLDPLPVTYELPNSPYASVGSWTAGTNRGTIIESLSVEGDYFSPWFANNGVMKFVRVFDPATKTPTFDFDEGNSVFQDGITMDNDVLIAPNRYIVVSNSGLGTADSATPIVGRYDVPNSAPYSIINRGFVIPSVTTLQLSDGAQATAVARNLGQRNTVFERTVLNTAIDPRHDGYDVIRWRGENWLELAWSFRLSMGSPMRHLMRKAYS